MNDNGIVGKGEERVMALEELENIPQLSRFPEILEAASAGRLVIFIGAGVSRIIGCPSWQNFAKKYLQYLYEKNFIDYHAYHQLKNFEARKLLSICDLILEKGMAIIRPAPDPPNFNDFLIADDNKSDKYPIYQVLYDFNAIYVTTNFDCHLDEMALKRVATQLPGAPVSATLQSVGEPMDQQVFYLKEDMLTSNLNLGVVMHLHGSAKDKKSMIFTTRSYLDHYQIDTEPTELLKYIFSEKTVLFVGYGLDEFEILEHLIHKQGDGSYKILRHFMLTPIFKAEYENLHKYREMYFNDLGITLIPYPIDKNGYEQLFYVLEDWSKQIGPSAKPPGFYDKVSLIDEVI